MAVFALVVLVASDENWEHSRLSSVIGMRSYPIPHYLQLFSSRSPIPHHCSLSLIYVTLICMTCVFIDTFSHAYSYPSTPHDYYHSLKFMMCVLSMQTIATQETWSCRDTRICNSCHMHEWVTSHTWISHASTRHVAHTNELYISESRCADEEVTHECVKSCTWMGHTWPCHATDMNSSNMNTSCRTHEWVVHERVTPHTWIHLSHKSVTSHTWMSYTWMSRIAHMNKHA